MTMLNKPRQNDDETRSASWPTDAGHRSNRMSLETATLLAACLSGFLFQVDLTALAAALRESSGRPWVGQEQALLERRLACARAALDPLVAAAALKEGQSMLLEDAIAYANSPLAGTAHSRRDGRASPTRGHAVRRRLLNNQASGVERGVTL